jgi:hypothetical protein
MTEQHLNDPDIDAHLKQIRRKCVPKSMGSAIDNARPLPPLMSTALDHFS